MFRGARPLAQPRTLRSIAEDKGTMPAGFLDGGVAPGSGLPDAMPTAHETYFDAAGVGVVAGSPAPLTISSPFGTLRRGR